MEIKSAKKCIIPSHAENEIYKENFNVSAEQSLMLQCGKDRDYIKDWIWVTSYMVP